MVCEEKMKLINYEEDIKTFPPIGDFFISGANYIREDKIEGVRFFGYYKIEENENRDLHLYCDRRNKPTKKI